MAAGGPEEPLADQVDGSGQHAAEFVDLPVDVHGCEPESTVHPVAGHQVGQALWILVVGLAEEVGVVLVADGTPPAEHVVALGLEHIVEVVEGQPLFVPVGSRVPRSDLGVGAQQVVLDQSTGHVDSEATDPAVQPEAQDPVELLDHGRVAPVEVGLFRQEQVHVVLAGGLVEGPGRAAEVADPVVGRAAVGARSGPDVVVAVVAVGTGEGVAEPGVGVAGMIGHQVDEDPQAPLAGGGDQGVEVVEGAEAGIDIAVVGDVVAPVGHGRRVERSDPDEVDAQVCQVVETVMDTDQVADAVTVRVGERPDVHLIADRAVPPASRIRSCS